MTFSVLFVCTGNVCRSPSAQLLFDFASNSRAISSSAGLNALDGHPVDGPTAAVLQRIGLFPAGHRARQLSTSLVTAADLVLTAEVAQRDQVMLDIPTAFQRTFTLKEFARAGREGVRNAGRVGRADEVVALAARYRGWTGSGSADSDDIADTYGGTIADARRMVVEVDAAINEIVHLLGFPRPRPRPGSQLLTARLPTA